VCVVKIVWTFCREVYVLEMFYLGVSCRCFLRERKKRSFSTVFVHGNDNRFQRQCTPTSHVTQTLLPSTPRQVVTGCFHNTVTVLLVIGLSHVAKGLGLDQGGGTISKAERHANPPTAIFPSLATCGESMDLF